MSLASKILGNTFWQIFGRIVTAAIAFVTVGFLTNYWGAGNVELGQAKYGTYATIYEFLAIFGSLADLGIFTIAVREMSKQKDQFQEIFSSTLSLRVISLVVAMGVGILSAFLIPQYAGTEIPKGVAIAAVGTGLFILSGSLSTVLLVHLKMKLHAIALVVGKILTFGIILSIIFVIAPEPTEESFYSLMWAGVWGALLTLMMTFWYVRNFLQVRMSLNKPLMTKLFYMALPFGIATFLNTIYFRLDITMMGILLPHSQDDGTCLATMCGDQQAGIYAVAVRIMEVLIILPLYFMNSVLPSLSGALAEKKTQQVQHRLSLSFLFLFLLALPAVIGLCILAKPIVEMITPPDFGSEVALQILTAPLFFTFFTTFLSFALIAFGEQKKILWINFYAVILNFLLNIWAIPRYGFLGAAITSLLSEGFILVLGVYFVLKIVRFSLQIEKLIQISIAAVCMGICTFFSWRYWGVFLGIKSLALIIPLAMGVYGVLLWYTKVIDQRFIEMLKRADGEQKI